MQESPPTAVPVVPQQQGLKQVIDWKGAFVIGLAGTILVTGVTGPVLGEFRSAAVPNFIIVTLMGLLLCLILAELATMFPDWAGGAPAYAYMGFRERWPRLAGPERHHRLGLLAGLEPGYCR